MKFRILHTLVVTIVLNSVNASSNDNIIPESGNELKDTQGKSFPDNNGDNIVFRGNHHLSVTCGGLNIGSIAYALNKFVDFRKTEGWFGLFYLLRTNLCYEYYPFNWKIGLIAKCGVGKFI